MRKTAQNLSANYLELCRIKFWSTERISQAYQIKSFLIFLTCIPIFRQYFTRFDSILHFFRIRRLASESTEKGPGTRFVPEVATSLWPSWREMLDIDVKIVLSWSNLIYTISTFIITYVQRCLFYHGSYCWYYFDVTKGSFLKDFSPTVFHVNICCNRFFFWKLY